MSTRNEEAILEEIREQVEMENPEVLNAIDHSSTANKRFTEYCEKYLDMLAYERYQNMPDMADQADLQISSNEVNS